MRVGEVLELQHQGLVPSYARLIDQHIAKTHRQLFSDRGVGRIPTAQAAKLIQQSVTTLQGSLVVRVQEQAEKALRQLLTNHGIVAVRTAQLAQLVQQRVATFEVLLFLGVDEG